MKQVLGYYKTKRVILLSIFILASNIALTKNCVAEEIACGTSQPEMTACAADEFQKVDRELNTLYQQLYQSNAAKGQIKLRAAELEWIKFRDAHCDYLTFGAEMGTIYNQWVFQCKAAETRRRIRSIQKLLDCKYSQIFCDLDN